MQSMSEYCETELKKLYFNRKYSVGYGAGLCVRGIFDESIYIGLYWSILVTPGAEAKSRKKGSGWN